MDLFNGKDLAGWVNVNTAPDTWKVRDGLLICSGHPDRRHAQRRSSTRTSSCTSSGCTWSPAATPASSRGATPSPIRESRLPNGVEVQMLELDWPKLNKAQRRHAADRLRPRRAVRRRRREDDARQSARRAQQVDREPLQGQGRVEHLRRRRGRRRHQARRSTASSSTASASRRRRRAISAWSRKARRSTSATSASWSCRLASRPSRPRRS